MTSYISYTVAPQFSVDRRRNPITLRSTTFQYIDIPARSNPKDVVIALLYPSQHPSQLVRSFPFIVNGHGLPRSSDRATHCALSTRSE